MSTDGVVDEETSEGAASEVSAGSDGGARGISVVVPVKGRVEQLRELLASMAVAMRQCPEPAEVLVVDDSSPTDTERHRANCRQYGARYVRGPRHVGAKRNLGARLASYDLVLCMDSDCRADADLLRRHVSSLRNAPPDVAGVNGPALLVHSDTTIFRIMKRSYLLNGDLERALYYRRLPWATTCNLVVRKSAWEAVGGFPEQSLTVVAGEDVDFGLRLTDAGYEIRCDPDARVEHASNSSDNLRSVLRRLFTYGRSEQWLCVAYPHRRRLVPNLVAVLAATTAAATAAVPRTGPHGLLAIPAVAAVVLASRTRSHLDGERTPRAALDAAACALIECCFDLGAAVAAFQLRRPHLVLYGFRPAEDATARGHGSSEPQDDGRS